MRHHIISNSEARQVFKAYKDTGGKFDTPAARLLVESLADKAARMTLGYNRIAPNGRKIAAYTAATGGMIVDLGEVSKG